MSISISFKIKDNDKNYTMNKGANCLADDLVFRHIPTNSTTLKVMRVFNCIPVIGAVFGLGKILVGCSKLAYCKWKTWGKGGAEEKFILGKSYYTDFIIRGVLEFFSIGIAGIALRFCHNKADKNVQGFLKNSDKIKKWILSTDELGDVLDLKKKHIRTSINNLSKSISNSKDSERIYLKNNLDVSEDQLKQLYQDIKQNAELGFVSVESGNGKEHITNSINNSDVSEDQLSRDSKRKESSEFFSVDSITNKTTKRKKYEQGTNSKKN